MENKKGSIDVLSWIPKFQNNNGKLGSEIVMISLQVLFKNDN